jgi:hypothetical protein
LYFEWRTENVFYCPANQTIDDTTDLTNPGFDNFLLNDTEFVYSDDAAEEWKQSSFSVVSGELNNEEIGDDTTSPNHKNRPLIK